MSLTYLLIALIVLVSFYAWSNPKVQANFIMNPYRIAGRNEYHRFITSAFIHADYLHLFFNLFTLYFFGRYVEHIFVQLYGGIEGKVYFLLLFLLGVVVSDLPTFFKYRHNPAYNALGASGGVSSLVFSFILFNPTEKLYLLFIPIGIPGFILGVLFLIYAYYQAKSNRDNINHSAHFYGALFGVVFCILLHPQVIPRFFYALTHWRLF